MVNNKSKTILITIGFLVSIALIIFLGTNVIPKALVTISSRAESGKTISIKNSLIIGEVIMAYANGEDECKVNVFVLDKDGKGVQGKLVQLSGLEEQEALTDATGKAAFKVVSTTAGQYTLTASVGGADINGSVTVTFR